MTEILTFSFLLALLRKRKRKKRRKDFYDGVEYPVLRLLWVDPRW